MRIIKAPVEIDAALRRYPWMDMSLAGDDGRDFVVEGSLSESYPCEIRIVFRNVNCVSSRRSWKTDTSRAVFSEVVDPEFNRAFHVEVGYKTFELAAEDVPTNMRFVAELVELEIYREPTP